MRTILTQCAQRIVYRLIHNAEKVLIKVCVREDKQFLKSFLILFPNKYKGYIIKMFFVLMITI